MAVHFVLCFLAVGPASAAPHAFGGWMLPGLHAQGPVTSCRATWCAHVCISIAKHGATLSLNWSIE